MAEQEQITLMRLSKFGELFGLDEQTSEKLVELGIPHFAVLGVISVNVREGFDWIRLNYYFDGGGEKKAEDPRHGVIRRVINAPPNAQG